MTNCGSCGAYIGGINSACENCLPSFSYYQHTPPVRLLDRSAHMQETEEAKKITALTKGMRDRADAIFDSDEKTALLLRHAAGQLQKLKMVYID